MNIYVCCAIIKKNGKILAAKRKQTGLRGGMWEFPGGKIEKNETPEQCIKREIIEELGMEIELIKKLPTVKHCYNDINIKLIPFFASALSEITRLESHEEADFFEEAELLNLKWSEADRLVLHQWLADPN
ncbi:MAG TPA: (deoxy)nucleoside triphosphate pyrophosphohydrolase [Salinivirgaceae bacterium]|nr:(deoxy)nucleoside triphosphate pyrophosphohydrolase [Salinivirgaceae bacterium]HQA76312.1 (deoxy)nucleoside triphosphate pyrophosphohydrolase [Salinivirgaceae bacterium]